MIKAVFFDFDGVLTKDKTGSTTTTRYISEKAGLEPSAVKAAFARHNDALTLGKTSHSEVWREICDELGRPLSLGLLQEAFASTPMNEGMLGVARELRRTHAVGVITDNKKDRIDFLRRRHGLDALFDPIVVSAEVGGDKSGQEIFLAALRISGVRASEALFIDNSEANLAVPGALGMRTCLHDDEKNDIPALIGRLRELGIAISDA